VNEESCLLGYIAVSADILEKHFVFIFRVEEKSKQVTTKQLRLKNYSFPASLWFLVFWNATTCNLEDSQAGCRMFVTTRIHGATFNKIRVVLFKAEIS
jgi:hypothetical protein